MSNLHIHEALQLIMNAPEGIPNFENWLEETFGADATFSNCSSIELTIPAVSEFLVGKGKIYIEDGIVFPAVTQMCQH